MEFNPDFSPSENAQRYLFNTSNGSRYLVVKRENGFVVPNALVIRLGESVIGQIAEAAYAPYWITGGRNQLAVCSDGSSTLVKLNDNLILNSAVAWTHKEPSELFLGSDYTGSSVFKGKITKFQVYKSALADQEVSDFWTHSTYNYRNKAVLDLPMRAAQHESTQTLDVSGNDNHAVFGAGAAAPTKLAKRGYSFDGGDYGRSSSGLFADTGLLTMACAVSLDNATRQSVFYIGEGVSDVGGLIQYESSLNTFCFYSGGGTSDDRACGTAMSPAGLHIIIGIYDGTNTRIIIDGREGTNAGIPQAPGITASMEAFIGTLGNFTQHTNGNIYRCIAFDFALTPLQVADLHGKMMRSINRV
jgi:hypothetical protein